jgi:hypothetical protein
MKTKTNVTLYICDHCKKKMQRKHAMEFHEKWCASNPENRRACEGCEHLEETTVEVDYGDNYFNEPVIKQVKAFRCAKLDKMLYPLKAEQRRLPERFPWTFENQEPMPKACEHKTNVSDCFDDLFN